jgi:cytochrome c biogenesis protein CcdA
MLRLVGIVVSIGLADSLNPTTIAPALYMAEGTAAVRRVVEFTIGVFVVYLAGGLLVVLGPGELIIDLVPRPGHTARHVIEIIAGVAMVIASAVLWTKRHELQNAEAAKRRGQGQGQGQGRSSAILGATISAVELPTAFPYFAAIAAVVGSGTSLTRQIFLIVLFNVCFVLPLIGIAIAIAVAGDGAEELLARVRNTFRAHWPRILAAVALVAGVLVILLGVSGLLSNHPFGRFVRGRLFQPLGLPGVPAPKK